MTICTLLSQNLFEISQPCGVLETGMGMTFGEQWLRKFQNIVKYVQTNNLRLECEVQPISRILFGRLVSKLH